MSSRVPYIDILLANQAGEHPEDDSFLNQLRTSFKRVVEYWPSIKEALQENNLPKALREVDVNIKGIFTNQNAKTTLLLAFGFDEYASAYIEYKNGDLSYRSLEFKKLLSQAIIELPEGTTTLCHTFNDTGIAALWIPKSVTAIKEKAFDFNDDYLNVYFEDSEDKWLETARKNDWSCNVFFNVSKEEFEQKEM